MTRSDVEATQDFVILNRLVTYTGQFLTGDLVEEIYEELKKDMHERPSSWAFRCPDEDLEDEKADETWEDARK